MSRADSSLFLWALTSSFRIDTEVTNLEASRRCRIINLALPITALDVEGKASTLAIGCMSWNDAPI
jgi:hypothetical protein